MNSLIKIQNDGRISAKNLYEFLELDKSNFTRWAKSNIEDNQFASENTDYLRLVIHDETPTGGRVERVDFSLSIDFAKKLCMISKSPRGEKARDYFIEVEKRYKKQIAQLPDFTNPAVAARAWADQFEKRVTAEKQIETDKPKVLFAESVQVTTNTILIRELAKMISQNGYPIGEKRLFEWLRNKGFLIKKIGADYNKPTQKAMELGLFKITECAVTHSDGVRTHTTARVTGKGQLYFVNKFLGEENIA